jgi:hypothetical protein
MSVGIINRPRLERVAFRTSHRLDFVGQRELVAQIGHSVNEWPLVVLKELLDNAIDACEEADAAPQIEIGVSTAERTIRIADNGPGIASETIAGILDYAVRVSSREAYVSPTRGAQGNALNTILAMAFALTGERGETVIESRGVTPAMESWNDCTCGPSKLAFRNSVWSRCCTTAKTVLTLPSSPMIGQRRPKSPKPNS